jgi:hypothetical protein
LELAPHGMRVLPADVIDAIWADEVVRIPLGRSARRRPDRMANMEELTTWLRSWYEVDERVARKALGDGSPRVHAPMTAGEAHIAAWAPERVLLDLALKQRILGLHRESQLRDGGAAGSCATCMNESWPCLTVRLLALPYAERSGYREEWRP